MKTDPRRPFDETAGHTVSFDEVQRLRQDPSIVLVDVLPPDAFSQARIAGSISLPVAEIPDRAREVLPDPTREIIVYCGSFG